MDWSYIAHKLHRTVKGCQAKLDRLKNDFDFKYKKPKQTKHVKKVTSQLVDAVNHSLNTDPANWTRYRRY